MSLNKNANIQTYLKLISILGVGVSFLRHDHDVTVLIHRRQDSHPKRRFHFTKSHSRCFFLFFCLIKKDSCFGILELHLKLSEKIQFECKNRIRHSRIYCWCFNLFACLCFHRKKKSNKINTSKIFHHVNKMSHAHKLKKRRDGGQTSFFCICPSFLLRRL